MKEAKSDLVAFAFAMLPYTAVAWGYSYFAEGGQPAFWRALGFLLVIRLFFAIIETIGGLLAWRLFFRKQVVDGFLELFRANQFPAKQYDQDDFSNYCARFIDGGPRKPDHIRVAQDVQSILLMHERRGIVAGMRMHAAVDSAFEQYIKSFPKSDKS